MNNVQNLSFQELGNRELLKPAAYWIGMVSVLAAAAYKFIQEQ